MNIKQKYSFWVDRTVDGFVYRFGDYKISRRPANSTLFETFIESDDRSKIIREWIKICDQAFMEEKESAVNG